LAYSPMNDIDPLPNFSSLKWLEMKKKEEFDEGEFVKGVFERMSNVNTVVIWETTSKNLKQQLHFQNPSSVVVFVHSCLLSYVKKVFMNGFLIVNVIVNRAAVLWTVL